MAVNGDAIGMAVNGGEKQRNRRGGELKNNAIGKAKMRIAKAMNAYPKQSAMNGYKLHGKARAKPRLPYQYAA